tara:strand:+ start:83 stop:208 length:126 start_codon:yes stop_codon:yes gene_type:complete
LYIKAVIEKKSKAADQKNKQTKQDAAKKNSKRALLFIYLLR